MRGTTHRLLFAASLVAIGSAKATATYSVVAVDESTREVGGAGASCVGSSGVARIYGSAPSIGVVHAQASSSPALRDEAVRRIGAGESPAEVLARLADPTFDRDAASRQYGVVTLAHGAAGFTGASALPFADDAQGTSGPLAFSVQGNILTGQPVLDRSREAFVGMGCDLADRLMRALEAAGAPGEGDRRCTESGVPADAAFIQVDRPGEEAGSYLFLEVRDTGAEDPVALLRARFDAWRLENPCPELPDAGVVGVDAGAPSRSAGCATATANGWPAAALVAIVLLRRRRSRVAAVTRG